MLLVDLMKNLKVHNRLWNTLLVLSRLKHTAALFKPFYYVLIIMWRSAFGLCSSYTLYVPLTWCRAQHVWENKKFLRRVWRGILHNTPLLPKTTIFLIIVRHIHDETHCSAALSCAVSLMISQPEGRFQGVNFWTEPLLTALTAKYFRTCKGDFFFLHPQRLPVCKIHFFFPSWNWPY